MTPDLSHFYLAHVIIETTTPLSISSGVTDGSFDTLLVRDANGLPTIPGTTLAGVLRHLYQQSVDKENSEAQIRELFGYAEGDQGDASKVHLSWACIHDKNNTPVEGLVLGDASTELQQDAVLKLALDEQPIYRDHVKINHRGTATDQGKFDRTALPSGYRFTFEISLWSKQAEDPRWAYLLGLLKHPQFRLGGATRRGYGAIKVVNIYDAACNVKENYKQYCDLPRKLGQHNNLNTSNYKIVGPSTIQCNIKLTPEDFWRFGGGNESASHDKAPADMLPVMEPTLSWDKENKATLKMRNIVIPASSIKGAMAHRLAYHHHCLTNNFVEDNDDITQYEHTQNHAVRTLLGFAKDDRENGNEPKGQVGHLVINDIYIEEKPEDIAHKMMHTSIDRFSGGVRHGALFSEELFYETGFELTLTITQSDETKLDTQTRQALKRTLDDLCNGNLPLGAATTKGHGYFNGEPNWQGNEHWFEEKTA